MTNESSLTDTDLCVMCGMCTPHCPTYRIYNTETESPRGRIALIQALDKDRIKPSKKVMDYLNHCMGCLACERICPSGVPFGKLIDTARQRFSTKNHSFRFKFLLKISQHENGLDHYQPAIRFLKQSKLIQLLPQQSKTRLIIEQAQGERLQTYYPAQGSRNGTIGIFKGCMGQTFDISTFHDAIHLLTHFGLDVHIPDAQHCCGALHQHHGEPQNAEHLASQNKQLFDAHSFDKILYLANGCGSQIINTDFSIPVMDIGSFILEQLNKHATTFKPLQKHAVVHQSCRAKNELGLSHTNQQLIQHIPGIQIIPIQHEHLCCGAGGGNQIDFPELANQLLDIKLDELKNLQADYLISDNIGCSLHFKSGFKLSQITTEVVHPITLLARQMI